MARPVGKRYPNPIGAGPYVIPSRIRRFSKEFQKRLITDWFFDRFENPRIQETTHNGSDGGYLYIHGGPYDAREAIEAEFNAVVSADVIDKAINYVESDGTFEWAPGPNHPDRIADDSEPIASVERDNVQVIRDTDTIDIKLVSAVHRSGHKPQLDKQNTRDIDDGSGAPDRNSLIRPDVDAQEIDTAEDLRSGALFKGDSKGTFMAFGKSQESSAYGSFSNFEEIEQRIRNGVAPHFGSDREKALRAELRERAAALLELLDQPPGKHGGIGHNQPPSDLELDAKSKEDLRDAAEAIRKALSGFGYLRVPEVAEATRTLRKVISYLASKAELTVDAFCTSFGIATGKLAAGAVVTGVFALLADAVGWLDVVTWPF